jgi:hypothetical protein
MAAKVATSVRGPFIVIVHTFPTATSHPVHPMNRNPVEGAAVNAGADPVANVSAQSPGHAIPVPVTVPPPAGATCVVSSFARKVANSVRCPFIVIVQLLPDGESHPTHAPKTNVALGVAVNACVDAAG